MKTVLISNRRCTVRFKTLQHATVVRHTFRCITPPSSSHLLHSSARNPRFRCWGRWVDFAIQYNKSRATDDQGTGSTYPLPQTLPVPQETVSGTFLQQFILSSAVSYFECRAVPCSAMSERLTVPFIRSVGFGRE